MLWKEHAREVGHQQVRLRHGRSRSQELQRAAWDPHVIMRRVGCADVGTCDCCGSRGGGRPIQENISVDLKWEGMRLDDVRVKRTKSACVATGSVLPRARVLRKDSCIGTRWRSNAPPSLVVFFLNRHHLEPLASAGRIPFEWQTLCPPRRVAALCNHRCNRTSHDTRRVLQAANGGAQPKSFVLVLKVVRWDAAQRSQRLPSSMRRRVETKNQSRVPSVLCYTRGARAVQADAHMPSLQSLSTASTVERCLVPRNRPGTCAWPAGGVGGDGDGE